MNAYRRFVRFRGSALNFDREHSQRILPALRHSAGRRLHVASRTTCCGPARGAGITYKAGLNITSGEVERASYKSLRIGSRTALIFLRGSLRFRIAHRSNDIYHRPIGPKLRQTGELPMFIAMNRFQVKKGSEQAFETVLGDRVVLSERTRRIYRVSSVAWT